MSTFTVSKICVMTCKKGNCAEFGPMNVFQFESDSVKPISCMRIKVIAIIIIKSVRKLKTLRQPSLKFWPKILTPYFFPVISTYTSQYHAVKIFSILNV